MFWGGMCRMLFCQRLPSVLLSLRRSYSERFLGFVSRKGFTASTRNAMVTSSRPIPPTAHQCLLHKPTCIPICSTHGLNSSSVLGP